MNWKRLEQTSMPEIVSISTLGCTLLVKVRLLHLCIVSHIFRSCLNYNHKISGNTVNTVMFSFSKILYFI